MIEWKSLMLKDVGPFDNVQFNIPKGVTTIYGANDSISDSNAAGKSMLFTSIFDTLCESPVDGTKADRIQRGVRGVQLVSNGEPLRLIRSGKSAKLQTSEGVISGVTKVRNALPNYFPLSWNDLITYVHLDSQVPHPLVKGSNAQRKHFLSSFFMLDRIDDEKALIKSRHQELARLLVNWQDLQDELAELRKDLLPEPKANQHRKAIRALQLQLDRLQASMEKNEAIRRASVFMEYAQKHIDRVKVWSDYLGEDWSNPDFHKLAAKCRSAKKVAEKLLRHARNREVYDLQHQEYAKWRDSLSPEAIRFLKKHGRKATTISHDAVAKHNHALDSIKEIEQDLEGISIVKPKLVSKPKHTYESLIIKEQKLNHAYEHALNFDKGICPTCDQEVETVDIESVEAELVKVRKILKQVQKYREYVEAYKEYESGVKEYEAINTRLDNAKKVVQKYSSIVQIHDCLVDAPQQPKEYVGPKTPSIDRLESRISNMDALAESIKIISANWKKYTDYQNIDISEVKVHNVPEVANLLMKHQTVINNHERTLERIETLTASLNELKSVKEEHDRITKLLSCYDDKAMKRMVINAISVRLMAQVNKYAKVAFKDSFQFELVWETNQVQLLVRQRFANYETVFDVRRLSGAETKLFTIILLMAHLAFVPNQRRSSMLVLDEPTANFGEANELAFRELLTILKTMYQSIIIITPRTNDRFGGNEYTIVKAGGDTRIEKGHPSTLQKV